MILDSNTGIDKFHKSVNFEKNENILEELQLYFG